MSDQPSEKSSDSHSEKIPSSVEKLLIVDSKEILQGRNEVLISHFGETYRLRLTRSGKLLLQK